MARLSEHGLRRVLGTSALFSTAYGNVGSSIYYALGLVASFALGLTPVVFIVTGFIFYLTAATYAEATTMYPEAGGSSSFARHAFNELWSFFAAWAQMLNYTITIAISAFFVPHYLGGLFWPALQHGPGDVLFGIGVVTALSVVNVVGVREAAGLNVVLAVTDLATQLLLVIVGVVLVLSPHVLVNNVHLGVAPTWKNFLIAIPIGMIAYTGIETISNMAEEARDETRTVPRAIKGVVIAVFAIYAALPMVALSALPVHKQPNGHYATLLGTSEAHGGFAGDPVLGIVKHLHLGPLQSAGEIYVGLLAATILFIAANAGIIGASRLIYSMGLHRQVPERLSRLHPRFSTPWVGILLFGGVACLTIIPGKAEFLGNMYAFGAMLSFTMAHLSVIRLRFTKRDFPRPYKGPGNVMVRGVDLPLFAIAGGFFTAVAFVVIVVLNLKVAAFGVAWLTIGVVIYYVFRHRHGLDLTSTHKVAIPTPVVDHEAEYDSVLVPLGDGHYDESVVATAAKLAARRRRGIHVLALVTVPSALPIDAPLAEAEAAAQSLVEQARVQVGARVSGHVERVRSGQAGRRIIEEAVDMRAAAIVMPLPSRSNGASLFGKTLETVLAERPCRVIIESPPAPRDGARRRALARAKALA